MGGGTKPLVNHKDSATANCQQSRFKDKLRSLTGEHKDGKG